MKLGSKGLDLIKDFEGFRSCPYRDAVGVWTIGYGSTKGVGPKSKCITREQAEARLRREVDETYGAAVNRLKLPLNQNQYDALTSFVYNLGPGAIGSDTGIGTALRAKQWNKAADQMLRWDYAGGKRLPGLTRRRKAERELFLKPTAKAKPAKAKPKPKAKPKGKSMATRKRLSPHFTIEEFDCKDGTRVMKRDYNGLEYLCKQFLEPLRKKYGRVTIHSGYRTKAHNARVGGESNSFHCYPSHDGNDQACDLSCSKGKPSDWHRTLAAIRSKKRGGKGGLGLYSSFVHVDIRDYPANWRG